jgi:hypothetical protein
MEHGIGVGKGLEPAIQCLGTSGAEGHQERLTGRLHYSMRHLEQVLTESGEDFHTDAGALPERGGSPLSERGSGSRQQLI